MRPFTNRRESVVSIVFLFVEAREQELSLPARHTDFVSRFLRPGVRSAFDPQRTFARGGGNAGLAPHLPFAMPSGKFGSTGWKAAIR
jgi:hypothetical protein